MTIRSPEEWHIFTRIKKFAGTREPLSTFFDGTPISCHWCGRRQDLDELTLGTNYEVSCINRTGCEKARLASLKKTTADAPGPSVATEASTAPKQRVRRVVRPKRGK